MKRPEPGPTRLLATVLVATALLLGAAACGNLTMGGVANARVVVSGDAPDGASALGTSGAPAPPSAPVRSSHGGDEPEGQIELDFALHLVSETGSLTRLGPEEIEVRMDVQGRTEVETVNELIPVARYVELRVVFTDIRVEVSDGLIIDGVPVTGEIRVEFDDVVLPVYKPIDLDVVPGAEVELLIDMNTPAWLAAVDPVTHTVDPTVFADLMAVVVR